MTIRFLAAVLIGAAACAPTPRAPTEKRPMIIQEWKGQNDGPAEAGALVATDQASWERAWRQVGKDAPPLDFSNFVGAMVFVGQKPTGGWTVVFDEPVARGDDAVVRYHVPKPGGFTTQAFTQPWKARAFPRPKGRLILEAAPQ
jgi:protease stability complex PrcB-like protein